MIKLVHTNVRNFRQLREVAVVFASDSRRTLTIIRAENGTGKTTLLHALTWGLFGDEVLPGKRSAYRMHPLDWDSEGDGTVCQTDVEIRFMTIDDETGMERTFDLVRSARERLTRGGSFQVAGSELMLFEQTSGGYKPVTNPNAFIQNRVLPTSLRDIFFIDGDRALSFIETTDERSAKRDRVQRAVRQLLGLDILEKADNHVEAARRVARSAVRKEASGTSLERLAALVESESDRLGRLKTKKRVIDEDRRATESRQRKATTKLHEALAAGGGDRRKLGRDLKDREKELTNRRSAYKRLVREQRALVNNSSVLLRIASGQLRNATDLLAKLETTGVIPDTLPDVVRDRLGRKTCICGRDVSEGTDGHVTLVELLSEVDRLDESHEVLLHLSTATRILERSNGLEDDPHSWVAQATNSLKGMISADRDQRRLEKEIKELETRIGNIPEQNIDELQKMVMEEEAEAKRLTGDAAVVSERIRTAKRDLEQVKKDLRSALTRERKHRRRLTEEIAAMDVQAVIRGTIDTLESETVDEVSSAMNEIFLQMIVADPEDGGIINRAQLTRQHDIVVFGFDEQKLDPDKDLSGAQRRALTLAFILGLVRVSGVKAPNVVDTPLGMTSALVRRSLLEYAARNSTQLVLFLTGSEIQGVEDILDRYAGRTYTMSFTDHYPRQLANKPETDRLETLVCECDYRSSCRICKRKAMV